MNSLKIFLENESAKTARELNAIMAEWEVIASKLEVLEDLTKKLKKKGEGLESEFFELAKNSASKTVTIRSTIVAYNKSNGRAAPKYKEAFEKALSIVTEEQKAFLAEFLKSVTPTPEGKESLKFTNPRVQKIAERLKNAKTEEEVSKLAAEILDLQPELEESLKSTTAKVAGWIAGAIKSLKNRLSRIDDAVANLKKVVSQKSLKESDESILSEADQKAISDIINSESYKAILNQAPKYAHEIVNSLEGDLVDMKRDPKNFQSLTLNMLKAPFFTKSTKQSITPVISRALEKLQGLVHQFLPKPAIKTDKSVWNGERVVREAYSLEKVPSKASDKSTRQKVERANSSDEYLRKLSSGNLEEASSSAPMVHATKDGRFLIGRATQNGKIEFKYVQGDGWLTINNRDMSTTDSKRIDFKTKAAAEQALAKLKEIKEGQSIHDTYKGKVIAYLEKNIPRTLTSLYEIDSFIAKIEAELGKSLNAVSPAQAQQALDAVVKAEGKESNLAKVTRKALKVKVFEEKSVHRVKADENSTIYFEGSYQACQDWIDQMSDNSKYKNLSFYINKALPSKISESNRLSEEIKKDPIAVLRLVEQTEEKLLAISKAMDDVVKISSAIPRSFKTNIHYGNINNIESPKEYAIWVCIENIKSLYSLDHGLERTKEDIASLKKLLKEY